MKYILTILALFATPLDTAWWADDAPPVAAEEDPGLLDSLVGYWEMEENGSESRIDSHTGGFDMGAHPATALTRSSDQKLGTYAVQFDGSSGNYMSNYASAFTYNGGYSFSVNFWFRRNVESSNSWFVGQWVSAAADESAWSVVLNDNHEVVLTIMSEGLSELKATNSTQVTDQNYHMVTAVYNAATSEGTVYLDSVPETTVLDGIYDSQQPMVTLGDYSLLDPSMVTIDAFAWWTNRVLSSNRVSDLYNSGSGLGYGSF